MGSKNNTNIIFNTKHEHKKRTRKKNKKSENI